MKNIDKYYDLKGLAAYTSFAVPTLREYLRDPVSPIPYFKIKGKIVVRRSEFDQWIENFRISNEDISGTINEILQNLKSESDE